MAIFSAQRGIEKKIQKLKPELARKIAAGEVIDRPHAVVRSSSITQLTQVQTIFGLKFFQVA